VTISAETEERILDEAEYLADREQRSIVEREFQTAIEACLDIASLLCKELYDDVPAENARKFAVLAEGGVLSAETAERMAEAAGFRNVLAHNYGDDIDDEQVYHSLQTDLDWFPTFLRDVREYLT
jgi:uncharacterized protein YutE (UPF0331/DUF86 family)